MFCTDIPAPYLLIFSNSVPPLLYYSHISTAIVALVVGFFVFFSNRKNLANQLLVIVAILFSTLVFLGLIIWTNIDSRIVTFSWLISQIVYLALPIFSLYLFHVFVYKKDVRILPKIIWSSILAATAVITSLGFTMSHFDLTSCEVYDKDFLFNYQNLIFSFVAVSLIVEFILKIRSTEDKIEKKSTWIFFSGMLVFLILMISTWQVAGKFDYFQLEQYGLFGMVIFMGFLAYLIVKYKAFNIKLIATQALVAALIIGIGSQFFFIQNTTNIILNGITLLLILGFGYMLTKSVKLEIKQKEEIQELYKEEEKRKIEIQKMADDLSVANDKLHQLDKAKSEFISIASHQLRTPPTAVKGFGSLLLEGTYGELNPAQKSAIEKIYISNERQLSLVEDLLNISRIEAGRMEFDFQETQIEDLVNEAVMTLELSAKAKDLYLNWQKPETPLPKIMVDGSKIKEVISNMVDNSIKYTQKGGVSVKVENDGKSIRVVVFDTGIGMDEEEIHMIFEKFQRGKQVAHYHTDGTGLGMYIGKKIVAEHKGRIWAESEGKGRGSRFILELPLPGNETSNDSNKINEQKDDGSK